MDEFPGVEGGLGSLALRLGQAISGIVSLVYICLANNFYSFTSFCFLVTTMGLVVPWSLTLAVSDAYTICAIQSTRPIKILSVIVVGDGLLATLTLGASCSAASVADALMAYEAPVCKGKACIKFRIAAVMAFLSWSLLFASFLLNFWLLATLTLGASCSAASVADALMAYEAPVCKGKACIKFRIAAVMAFLSWSLLFASFLLNFWVLPST
ncbi:CASP-like protein ARALYDRAFT_485429 [Andrographis paniculata]|uniref:CASP-like protein ARALYDRAFT_485429 n=1 Tax=Andrographis paniculata TaxID=175694 RepID=UPI0021E6EC91|nr:CASP-like protein ARALYDRAFT_485429 [Andrographis paniculata]